MSSPLLRLGLVYLVISFYLLTQVRVLTGIDCAGSAYQLQMTSAYILYWEFQDMSLIIDP
jgi:hypothetical protein